MFLVDTLRVPMGSSELMLAELSARMLCSRVDMWRHRRGMSCTCPGRPRQLDSKILNFLGQVDEANCIYHCSWKSNMLHLGCWWWDSGLQFGMPCDGAIHAENYKSSSWQAQVGPRALLRQSRLRNKTGIPQVPDASTRFELFFSYMHPNLRGATMPFAGVNERDRQSGNLESFWPRVLPIFFGSRPSKNQRTSL